jgi:hypothetical protein
MVVDLADIVRRTNALSEITFDPQDLIRHPSRVQNACRSASRSSSRKTASGEWNWLGPREKNRSVGRAEAVVAEDLR